MGPNGSGKSTLIESISWALYGNKSEIVRDGKEGIRSVGAGPNDDCAVQLIFEVGGVQYQLRRAMRGKDLKAEAELKANGELIASSDKGVTAQIEKALGMDYKAFFVSVFARQKDLSALSVLAPAERKKLIVKMLELDVLQDVLDDIRKDANAEKAALELANEQLLTSDRRNKCDVISEEMISLQRSMVALKESLEIANSNVRSSEELFAKAKGNREWTALKESSYRQQEKKLIARREELSGLKRSLDELNKDITDIRTRISSLEELKLKEIEYESLLVRKEALDLNQGAYEEQKSIKIGLEKNIATFNRTEEAFLKARKDLELLKDPSSSLSTVTKSLEELDEGTTKIKEKISAIDSEVKQLDKESKELMKRQEEIATMGPESKCPTCERTLGEHHRLLLSKLVSSIEEHIKSQCEFDS